MHRPSFLSKDGQYEKADASMTGSTHVTPPQRTQPETEAGQTRQGQSHWGAPNGYDAERAQRPCVSRGQGQAEMEPVPGRPPRAPRSSTVKPGATMRF